MEKLNSKQGIFRNRDEITRPDLRNILRDDRGIIPGTLGQKYSRGERLRLESYTFSQSKFGEKIKKTDFEKVIRNLRGMRCRARTGGEATEIDKKIRYLRRLGKG